MAKTFLPLVLLSLAPALLADEVRLSAKVHSSSEPVPVSDMVSGWDGAFTPGTYAYADGRLQLSAQIDEWHLSAEKRWYYYLEFSRGMSIFYHDQEQGNDSAEAQSLSLNARSFYAEGGSLGYDFRLTGWLLTPSLAVYQVYDYQFGQLNGVSAAGSSVSASATLDYHFSEDKILEYPVSPPAGNGYSMDLDGQYRGLQHWQLGFHLGDLLNRWILPEAGYTEGCINLGSSAGNYCSSSGAASGRSGSSDYVTRIPLTLAADAFYEPWQTRLSVFRHGRYQRLSIQKDWSTMAGDLGVSLHSTRQLGLHWGGSFGRLEVLTDDQRLHSARDLQLNMEAGWRW